MDENTSNGIAVVEQNAVLKDIRTWLKANVNFLKDKKVTVASLDLTENNVTIVPLKGVRKRRQYACGGYQVYFPFAIYYRTSVHGTSDIEGVYDSMDSIGVALDSANLRAVLSGDREADSFYQDTTTVLLARKGAVTDFMATFVIIYSA